MASHRHPQYYNVELLPLRNWNSPFCYIPHFRIALSAFFYSFYYKKGRKLNSVTLQVSVGCHKHRLRLNKWPVFILFILVVYILGYGFCQDSIFSRNCVFQSEGKFENKQILFILCKICLI